MFRWLGTTGFSFFREEGVSFLLQEESGFYFLPLFLFKEKMLDPEGRGGNSENHVNPLFWRDVFFCLFVLKSGNLRPGLSLKKDICGYKLVRLNFDKHI